MLDNRVNRLLDDIVGTRRPVGPGPGTPACSPALGETRDRADTGKTLCLVPTMGEHLSTLSYTRKELRSLHHAAYEAGYSQGRRDVFPLFSGLRGIQRE